MTVNKVGYDLFDCSKIIIPVHQLLRSDPNDANKHWVLVVVNLRQGTIEYSNSYRETGQLHKPGGLNIVVRHVTPRK